MKVAIICIHSSARTCNCLPMTQINKQQRLYAIASICKTHAVKSRQHLDCLLADLLTSAADLLTNSPSTSYNLFHTNRCNRVSSVFRHWFSITLPWPKLCRSITYRHWIGDSWLSATENQLLVGSRHQLSTAVGDSMHSESLVLRYS